MTCEEFAKLLDNYENLTDEEKSAINEHTLQCEQCRAELDFTLAIIAELNTLPAIEVPADFGAKLNERLDLEKRAASGLGGRILSSARRYCGRYSAVAACLALAVVIGANGKTIMERLNPADGGNNPVTAVTDKTPEPAVDKTPTDTADTPQTKTEPAKQEVASSGIQTAMADISGDKSDAAPVRKTSGQSAYVAPVREIPESVNEITVNQSEKARESVYEAPAETSDAERTADENAGTAAAFAESRSANRGSDNYTIARGVYRLPDPEIAEAEAPEHINIESLDISEIDTQPEITIARGRYYIPSDEGYVSLGDGNEIGVSGEDAERAAELIGQYAEENDPYYVINSEDIPSMLEHMDGEGIKYENKMGNSDNEKVGFKLVIE